MELNKIISDTKKIESLKKKNILTVEGLLKRPPLEYLDFTRPMPLTEETMRKMAGRPFAVTGVCEQVQESSYSNAKNGRELPMLKITIRDSQTGQKLRITVFGVDNFKRMVLHSAADRYLEGRYPQMREVWEYTDRIYTDEEYGYAISEKCEEGIVSVNNNHDLDELLNLRTGGKDGWSSVWIGNMPHMFGRAYDLASQILNGNMLAQCLRWYGRGLDLVCCIKKVLLEDSNTFRDILSSGDILCGGKIEYDEFGWSMLNPVVFEVGKQKGRIYTRLSSIKGFTERGYRDALMLAMQNVSDIDYLPDTIKSRLNVTGKKAAFKMLQYPTKMQDIRIAERRFDVEDMAYFASKITLQKSRNIVRAGFSMPDCSLASQYISSLPFSLTKGQLNAIRTISADMRTGRGGHTLIQGDVGTGKTAVAITLMLIAVASGYQAALAVPYVSLALQHYKEIAKVGEKLGITVASLTSDTKAAQKKKIYKGLEDGSINVIVGTHSIFSTDIKYRKLGLVISDEEHKFGVIHRTQFEEKAIRGSHIITMSATPIPRSIAVTLYGEDARILSIPERPAGRLPIQTSIVPTDVAAAKVIVKEVKKGHQAFIVCPSIDSENMASVEEKAEIYRRLFHFQNISIGVITGKTKADERNEILESFTEGRTDVLIATTVIEVGINVPNATCIVICGADRFGLSTLHQLRGRVGRSSLQSYCVLVSDKEEETERLTFMTKTTDGFKLAEYDLKLRGPGSLFGERQSGQNRLIEKILLNQSTYREILECFKEGGMINHSTMQEYIERYERMYCPEEE